MLAPNFAHIGMAWAIVTAEAFVSFSMVRAVMRLTSFFRDPIFAITFLKLNG
jgi:hypothetical protein